MTTSPSNIGIHPGMYVGEGIHCSVSTENVRELALTLIIFITFFCGSFVFHYTWKYHHFHGSTSQVA